MTQHADHIGDVFDVTNIGGRVTVMRGPSVVMDCVIEGDWIRVLHASHAAPSELFVARALGLVKAPEPEPGPNVAPEPAPPPEPALKRRRGLNR